MSSGFLYQNQIKLCMQVYIDMNLCSYPAACPYICSTQRTTCRRGLFPEHDIAEYQREKLLYESSDFACTEIYPFPSEVLNLIKIVQKNQEISSSETQFIPHFMEWLLRPDLLRQYSSSTIRWLDLRGIVALCDSTAKALQNH